MIATMSSNDGIENLVTMRDINDYCVKRGLPSLAQGMIELPPPKALRQRVGEIAMRDTVHTYRNRYGELDYRESICSFLANEYSTTVNADNVLATHGVTGGIVSTLALVKERGGSRIGLVEPFYTYHIFQIERVFGTKSNITYLPLKEEKGVNEAQLFSFDWPALEKALARDSACGGLDLLIVCSPSNPTGRVWSREELSRLTELTRAAQCMLLLDECYSDMVWQGSFYSPVQEQLHDHVVAVRGFSKVLGCQSWRVGYLISTKSTVDQLMRLSDPIYICTPWLMHALGDFLQDEFVSFLAHKKEVGQLIQQNWAKLSEALRTSLGWTPIQPQGTMYGMLRHTESSDIEAVRRALAKGVGVCPGSMFYDSKPNTGFVRIHCGVSATKADSIVQRLLSSS